MITTKRSRFGDRIVGNESIGREETKERDVKHFAFYVTGHGYGHATRVVEICREIMHRGHTVIICTCASPSIFTRDLPEITVRQVKRPLDVGGVQLDALNHNIDKTLEKYFREVHQVRQEIIGEEADWIRQADIDMVLVDSPPLACTAAHQAGRPSCCITNLVWHHIYHPYLEMCPPELREDYREMIEQIRKDYGHATALLRLPGHSQMKESDGWQRVIDVPLVARKAKRSLEEVREFFGIDKKTKIVLISFGGHNADWPLSNAYLPEGWIGLVTGMASNSSSDDAVKLPLPSRFIAVLPRTYIPDLVNASDVMIGKIGYGTVSEVIAHHVPLIYIPRIHWNEQGYLLDYLQSQQSPAIPMSVEDFYAGNWASAVEQACALGQTRLKGRGRSMIGNGTERVVDVIEEVLANATVGR